MQQVYAGASLRQMRNRHLERTNLCRCALPTRVRGLRRNRKSQQPKFWNQQSRLARNKLEKVGKILKWDTFQGQRQSQDRRSCKSVMLSNQVRSIYHHAASQGKPLIIALHVSRCKTLSMSELSSTPQIDRTIHRFRGH
jgi:hypothetical protein